MYGTRKNIVGIFCLAMLLLLSSPLFAQAKGAKEAKESKEAILIVAFGTSVQKAQTAYDNVEKQVKSSFPGKEIRWAWTAHSLLNSNPQAPRLSVQEALAKLATEKVKRVSILSLHIIPGAEYSNLVQTARAFEGLPKGIEKIEISPPLLFDAESVDKVAQTLIQNAPKARKADEALVFVGHGTHHAAGVYYPALQYYLHTLDKNAFVGTVEGSPNLEDVLKTLKANDIRKVWLAPLMTVAGDHAMNDLFGSEKDSWRQTLAANGIQVEKIARGLGENSALVELWVEGVKKAMK